MFFVELQDYDGSEILPEVKETLTKAKNYGKKKMQEKKYNVYRYVAVYELNKETMSIQQVSRFKVD